jgi:hypothetical protein
MARNDSLVSFRALAQVFVVDATDIGAADRRSLYPEQNFSVTGMRDRESAEFNFTVSGQKCSSHVLFHLFTH